MSRIVYLKGREWWISKRRMNSNRDIYPDVILVGRLDHERRYVPCKWKMDDDEFAAAISGLEELGDTELSHYNADCLLSAFLRSVGYKKAADAYDKLNRWSS